ncbi:IclR family transcriptional regulator [Verminephrobacter eiseniae]|uniref:IclR family transcriptional regulator n=1 Tax=Verminephrobacter eiseniae TaxID=364317 RepID=UPI002238C77E|nr:IclR family transcriptional regulator C-terminal domain-containing protein [Verminephrobacter eiseniae]MCW5236544.1 IclR family transcriptional regulator [Verminephrobacter eiseniae]
MPIIVPAAARTMSLLELFAREKRELSNADLARLLDLPESSCSDLLHTLHELGYLLRTARSRRFYPTARLLSVAREISASDPLYAVASEAAELLRDKTGETGLCGRIEAGVVKVLALTAGRHPLRYMQNVGDKLSLHVSALGKAILALGTPEEAARQLRLKPLRKIAEGSIVDLAALQAQVAQARAQGWIWVENEGGDGLSALAVAGHAGGAPLALSVAGPTDRLRPQRQALLAALQEVQALVFRPRSGGEPGAA